MKFIGLSVLLLVLTSCDPSAGHSFWMTNEGEGVTGLTCDMKDIQVRVDVSTLHGYTGGDLLVRFEMVDDAGEVMGEGTGEMYVLSTEIPEDKMLWIDVNPSTSKVMNYETSKPFNIFYACNNGIGTAARIRITYYEPSDSGENKIGYEDSMMVRNVLG